MSQPQASTSSEPCSQAHRNGTLDFSDDDDDAAFMEARTDVDNGETHDSSGDSDDSASTQDQEEDWHDPSELADLIEEASKCKTQGNTYFAAQQTSAALSAYKEGVAVLPAWRPPQKKATRKADGKGKGRQDLAEDAEAEDATGVRHSTGNASETHNANGDVVSSKIRELEDDEDEQAFVKEGQKCDEELQLIELRSTLWCNLAACHLKLSAYKEAAESAGMALKDKPDYVKALQRRAAANEKLDTWTSLSTALEDYQSLSKLSDTPKSTLPAIRQALRTLPARIEQRKQSETAEMMDKLKGLGNTFLGKFGMSTDNFQFIKDEKTGGYSMNFVNNPSKK